MKQMHFLPTAQIVLRITCPDGEVIINANIVTGDEDTAPTIVSIIEAMEESVEEYAEMYEVAPDKVKMLTVDEAIELGIICEEP